MTSPLEALLAEHPLPPIDGDKSSRGTAVIVAGSAECPGAALLAGRAALRAGAGKVQLVTDASIAIGLGIALPESLVVPIDGAGGRVGRLLEAGDAVLVGPGLGTDAQDRTRAVASHVPPDTPLLLDALAIGAAPGLVGRRLALLPNPAEAKELAAAASLPPLDDDGDGTVEGLAAQLAGRFGAAVAVRGEHTVVAGQEGRWAASGHGGLGTAGSGDVLSGIAVGVAARGCPVVAAVGWAVAVHAAAGHLAAEAHAGPGYGFIASDLIDHIPAAIAFCQAG